MCVTGQGGGKHACYNDCPLCWSMTSETLNGQLVSLGTIRHLSELAQLGCRFCKYLHNAAIGFKPASLRDVYPHTSITMQAIYHEDTSRGIELLNFTFKTIENNEVSAGSTKEGSHIYGYSYSHGPVEEHKWSFPIGGFSFDPEVEKLFPLKPANPVMSSDEIFQAARDCMADCLANHTSCRGTSSVLPRRVLRVDSKENDIVYVHVSQPQEEAQYVCLSYCWGEVEQVKLLEDTIDAFTTNGIAVDSLPQTIKDAVRATRLLNVPYLWIDSLCILQDNEKDKTEIIAQMPQIYKNATVTIAAASATNCGEGFLGPRKLIADWILPMALVPVLKTFIWPSPKEEQESIGSLYLCFSNLGYGTVGYSKEIINTRAWTFQESWLSKRLLIFGSAFPVWRCLKETKPLGPAPAPARRHFDIPTDLLMRGRLKFLTSALSNPCQPDDEEDNRVNSLKEWTYILEHYCNRLVTYRDDMLPALSGLASEYNRVLQDDYLCGLWSSSLPRSLLWTRRSTEGDRDPKDKRPFPLRMLRLMWAIGKWNGPEIPDKDLVYTCPSWSPLYAQSKTIFEKRSNYISSDPGESLIEIHDAVNKPVSSIAPFGKSLFCYLDLTGPMCRMSWSEVTSRFVFTSGTPHEYWDYISPDHASQIASFAREYGMSGNDQSFIEKVTTMSSSGPEDVSFKILTHLPPRTPPPEADDPLPEVRADMEDPTNMVGNETEFWFLEVTNTHTPSGLFLKRLRWNVFIRLGFFHMGRKITPDFNEVTGIEDVGRRKWDWESLLRMRRIYLV